MAYLVNLMFMFYIATFYTVLRIHLQGDWGDALVKNGVFYAQNIGSVDEGFCTADAKPGVFADILAVAGWIKATTGAKYDNQL